MLFYSLQSTGSSLRLSIRGAAAAAAASVADAVAVVAFGGGVVVHVYICWVPLIRSDLHLSKELLLGVESLGFRAPSKIQAAALPLVLNHQENLIAQVNQ